MAQLTYILTSISRPGSGQPPGRRILAAVLSAMLLLGSVSPGAALASEVASEGEGTAPPGAIEGGPDLDPGGEETVLEELPGAPSGGGSEATGEAPPVEGEPQQESEALPPPAEATGAAAETQQQPPKEAPTAQAAAPEYAPAYEPAPSPPSTTPVENRPLSAPQSAPREAQTQHPQGTAQVTPEAPPPAGPSEVPEPAPTQPAATPVERNVAGGSLVGRHVHTVRAGECLWSIATALLPANAGNGEIAAEVQRLWRLNASRIGTDDPDLLMVGTKLRLR